MTRVIGEYPRRQVKRPSLWARWWESLLALLGDEETLKRRRRSAGAKKAAATRKAKRQEQRSGIAITQTFTDATMLTESAEPIAPGPALTESISPGALAVLRDEFTRASQERKVAYRVAVADMGIESAKDATAEQGARLLAVLRGEA